MRGRRRDARGDLLTADRTEDERPGQTAEENPTRRTARLSVGYSETRGEEVVHVFGAPHRLTSGRWGPATWAVWERAVAEARASGSVDLDLDEFEAAKRTDDTG